MPTKVKLTKDGIYIPKRELNKLKWKQMPCESYPCIDWIIIDNSLRLYPVQYNEGRLFTNVLRTDGRLRIKTWLLKRVFGSKKRTFSIEKYPRRNYLEISKY